MRRGSTPASHPLRGSGGGRSRRQRSKPAGRSPASAGPFATTLTVVRGNADSTRLAPNGPGYGFKPATSASRMENPGTATDSHGLKVLLRARTANRRTTTDSDGHEPRAGKTRASVLRAG